MVNIVAIDIMPGKIDKYGRNDAVNMDLESHGLMALKI